MKCKMKKRMVALFLSSIMLIQFIAFPISNKSFASDQNEAKTVMSYEDSLNLPIADIKKDTAKNSGIQLYSLDNPDSIEDYKNLGYTNIQYSQWSGTKKVMSTKSKRIAKFAIENLIGFNVPGNKVKGLMLIYDLSSVLKTQHRDVWPTVNSRNIIATTPMGYETLIREESIVKYYSDSKRTDLLKTIHRKNFVW